MKLSDLKKDLSNLNPSASTAPKKPMNPIGSLGNAVGNMVASTSTLSSNQEKKVEELRNDVQTQMPDPKDAQSKELTMDRLAHLGVEIFNAHLPVLEPLYVPLNENKEFEQDGGFQPGYNIRWFQLNRWVTEKEEDSLDKLVNVYESLANENCNIALVFRRTCQKTEVYLGVVNLDNKSSKTYANALHKRLQIAQNRECVLVFTQFREMTDALDKELEKIFRAKGFVIHGGTSVKKRAEIVDAFNEQKTYIPYVVLSLKAAGTGLNLTQANHVIHFDRWWNPAVENQATDRAYRIGQNKNVIVHKFVCEDTIEEKIDELIAGKQKLADSIVTSSAESWLTSLSDDDLITTLRMPL